MLNHVAQDVSDPSAASDLDRKVAPARMTTKSTANAGRRILTGGWWTMGSVLSALEAIAEAAQAVIANKAEDVDPRLDYVIVQPDRDEWEALTEAVDEWIELTGRDHNQ